MQHLKFTRTLYQITGTLALGAAFFSTLIFFTMPLPKGLKLPFVLSTLYNYFFAAGAFARTWVLKGAMQGKHLPVWHAASTHAIGLSIAMMVGSIFAT